MICQKCHREFPKKKGRFCGTCLPGDEQTERRPAMTSELKPCPFCGCERILKLGDGAVQCSGCDVEAATPDIWNRRAEQPQGGHECQRCRDLSDGLKIISRNVDAGLANASWCSEFAKRVLKHSAPPPPPPQVPDKPGCVGCRWLDKTDIKYPNPCTECSRCWEDNFEAVLPKGEKK